MIFEKCNQEIETIVCNSCNETVLKLGPFCYVCGKILDTSEEDGENKPDTEEEIDFSKRILCSDGTCIGVVENGVCKVCGKPYVPESS